VSIDPPLIDPATWRKPGERTLSDRAENDARI
jgi:hypothetical protein